ncbi:noggin-1-like [Diadema antillarum]|uniref:noggin-1-like n=1 Tax=Diadema antillarum TaxID=105358 RepID=UPI003A8C83A2
MWMRAVMSVLLLVIVESSRSTTRSSTVLLTRPRPVLKPSDRVQPLPLLEDPRDYTRPQTRDLLESKLRRKLGNALNERWMSINEPTSEIANEVADSSGQRNTWLRRQLNSLNLSRDSTMLNLSSQEVTSLESWLMSKASCPVHHRWVYVGPLYWPPWVKHGSCPKKPCSWPDGMTCVPGDNTNIRMLRWHCRGRQTSTVSNEELQTKAAGGSSRNRQCKWLKSTKDGPSTPNEKTNTLTGDPT